VLSGRLQKAKHTSDNRTRYQPIDNQSFLTSSNGTMLAMRCITSENLPTRRNTVALADAKTVRTGGVMSKLDALLHQDTRGFIEPIRLGNEPTWIEDTATWVEDKPTRLHAGVTRVRIKLTRIHKGSSWVRHEHTRVRHRVMRVGANPQGFGTNPHGFETDSRGFHENPHGRFVIASH
jgi:hypothetical protein